MTSRKIAFEPAKNGRLGQVSSLPSWAYSPQARGRSERNFGIWQGRLPQELRLAGITDLEEANRFLEEGYAAAFNKKFAVAAAEKGTAFRRIGADGLGLGVHIATERVVSKDNTVAIVDRIWQLEKSRFRSFLAGYTVTIHEHLNGAVSIRYGPHVEPKGNSRPNHLNRTDHV